MNKLKLNSKGFGVIEGLLILVIVGIVGGVGYFVYNANKKTSSGNNGSEIVREKEAVEEKKEIPNGWVSFDKEGVTFYHPGTWVINSSTDRGEDYRLEDSESSLDVSIYKIKPRVYYSSNAPFLCLFDKEWKHFSINGSSLKAENDSECKRIKSGEENGNNVHKTDGGALGQFKYISVIEINGGYVVLQDIRNQEGYGDSNIGTFNELKDSINSLTKEFTKIN